MTSLEYWKERERAAAEEYAVTDEEALRRTQEVYARLLASVNDRINAFYSRYAAAEGITMNLAEQAVSSFDVKAFEATAAKMVAEKDFSPQANQQLRLYNATMRINRLEMLKAYIGLDTIDAGYDLDRIADYYLTDRSRQEFERQAGILGNSVRPTAKDVDDIVHSSFYNATFSQRIWANMSELHDELSTILTNGIIQGINPRQMTSRMAERFNVSEYDAERLLRTEMARVQTETQRQSFQMAGFEYYVFISLEGRACPVCAALDTGEPIPLEDFMPGETAPPIHPQCRCSVAAWMDREQMEKELGFALDEEEDEARKELREADFTPAKSIKEAEEYASQFVETGGFGSVGLSYKGVGIDVANEINAALNNIYQNFDIKKLGGLAAPDKRTKLGQTLTSAHFGYIPIRKSLVINRDKAKNLKDLTEALLADNVAVRNVLEHPEDYYIDRMSARVRNVMENSRESGRGLVPETVREGIYHEMGHFIEGLVPRDDYEAAIANRDTYGARISGYATDSKSEYFAESFASYMKGEDRIDPAMRSLFDSLRR